VTEAEWLSSADAQPMLQYLKDGPGPRKRRLVAVACCWRIGHLLTQNGRKAVEAAERFADGLIEEPELTAAMGAVGHPRTNPRFRAAEAARFTSYPPLMDWTSAAANVAVDAVWYDEQDRPIPEKRAAEESAQAHLLRDVVGNPFRPLTADPAWLTSTVVALAEGIYAERAFDRLPILADALQDAGCDNAEVLDHCRGPGPHARGCWVVDLLLGKS
jgi:hypothetical protein